MEELKRKAAVHAADYIHDGMVLGLGSGSTIRHLIDEIAARRRRGELSSIVGVPTSAETEKLAAAAGIPLTRLDRHPAIELTLDGADEVDPELRLIKGLGRALLREKIVAAASAELIVIVDASKRVDRLGTKAPLPLEVEPFGASTHDDFLRGLGAEPRLRLAEDRTPVLTDGGHYLIDCRFPAGIEDPEALDRRLRSRPGILETGLFLGFASRVVVASEAGIEVLEAEPVTSR